MDRSRTDGHFRHCNREVENVIKQPKVALEESHMGAFRVRRWVTASQPAKLRRLRAQQTRESNSETGISKLGTNVPIDGVFG